MSKFLMTPEIVADLLRLPDGVRVTSIATVHEFGEMSFEVNVEGDGVPLEGRAQPVYQSVDGVVTFKEWGS